MALKQLERRTQSLSHISVLRHITVFHLLLCPNFFVPLVIDISVREIGACTCDRVDRLLCLGGRIAAFKSSLFGGSGVISMFFFRE